MAGHGEQGLGRDLQAHAAAAAASFGGQGKSGQGGASFWGSSNGLQEQRSAGQRPPLCPAGHLPHLGGDQPSRRLSPISNAAG
ncbi:hypothetical protein EN836_31850 [Mesorhizobium sp. M1C.F.Ca.ET.193.01.1.1]|nr:hypothetical protein EN853_31845 [Mesorhizobium sp. M1C.F.Ca.ET.210.01.1.1]TGQ64333.1 hypothetical protein EN855_031860 [Mesorhizobium sp. M1C.F.Ca.ET.212.01.1.1]TGQ98069.1 hypothetical protein EN847_31845 [Mesorhizobium sp. M1C.F.Ca.ET.204.01.1.1]TGR18293.1 hypothetical protein EN839_31845 [Mesorhizobium sp. M1C.F.Ca.ET.196.01.1.1]TGR40343.1 hypothetical protein EN838_31850 [Mesorhizobium sp. M1C.F.Ca.ET.195.01.1.1]TGR60774.1 hypothetical protein EN835_031835 [Mesorhizobium sp. M1C.F.Ca.ET